MWKRTVLCMLRGVPTLDKRIVSPEGSLDRSLLPAPVYLLGNRHNEIVGYVRFLNEDDGGSVFADIEFTVDPASLEPGLYPEIDLDHSGRFMAMALGHGPCWSELQPLT